MLRLHVRFHGGHASHHEPISSTGQAHSIVLAHMVVQSLVVGRIEGAARAEVSVDWAGGQLHLRPTQGIA